MVKRILAGDVGGTKADLGLYEWHGAGSPRLVRHATLPSRAYAGLDALLERFLEPGPALASAAFGIAGPVVSGRVQVTNLPWIVEASELSAKLGCPVRLLNDLEAVALATLRLDETEAETLQAGVSRRGNRAVIAAGTGLGQAFLVQDGSHHIACATEGGHTDFAPRNDGEMALLRYLLDRMERVSWETVLSGPGLRRIFEFVVEVEGQRPAAAVTEAMQLDDPSQVIGAAGLVGTCAASARALAYFVALYGSQAGNLALATMATGGVFVAGGIAVKLLPAFRSGSFVTSFRAKPPFCELLGTVPIRIIRVADAARRGALQAACELLG